MSETAFNKGISDFREPMVTYALSLTKIMKTHKT